VVNKKSGAGFVGESCVIRLVELETDPVRLRYPSICMLNCGDSKCREWDNVEILEDGEVVGCLYHISECEMEDM